ncbi:glycosyltransferase [Tuwongella immobilis]|uniref:Erythromycin biosynthesis protein CIII-like C-terminal domain-containing protein n=1 Tax=Tuwongella immobilis TaxID=692036 RepID=A0A6C2YP44_9BACT|nr:nucleotide disphospho-sugar-binding domain-containing protein [Tuwongella immobilis]VIP02652.1 sterol 3-beta-glucosyltransferase : Sterol 3-beta-glucosyltransferase OS=Planctomyces limnophilus (strain ATCC 43296 / DSM 3776 / IFAM 1008 / 290) GN=Plim_3714 PE=4 SV=1: Glyco_transf_28: UDPGT [Tuwongella immobilis]VTS02045.1 sterol 3-beta-glucosyltransferase : Sterol 3-beta-glucosyltransferase OS=Planctomyces limnophilus (strain ATCC 43296 / DSM 3776 / IFAM 1008 / 290) GN=Plim_3714 PE=4 SV=1: Glyco
MKLGLFCQDTRGGVQPYLGLATELEQRGHRVRLFAPENFAEMAKPIVSEFVGLPGDIQAFLQRPEVRSEMDKGFLATHRLMLRMASEVTISSVQTALPESLGLDAMLSGFGGLSLAAAIAEKRDIPLVQAHVHPLGITGEFPGILGFRGPNWGIWNRLSHRISQQVFWQPMRRLMQTVRRDYFELPPAPFWGIVGKIRSNRDLILYGLSEQLLPRPNDWHPNQQMTGFWFLDPPSSWNPPESLAAFLDAGPPPIVVGFGSMSMEHAETTTRTILQAAESTGNRVVLLSGWSGLTPETLPDWAYCIESVPHSWLFPRAKMVIHHGGAGTTAAGLRAGVPSIIVPFAADQPYWAWLLQQRRLGIALPGIRKLSRDRLTTAIRTVEQSPEIQEQARRIGQAIRQESGCQRAADLLEAHLAT